MVIAVIAVLAALLLPALGKAKALAVPTACLSNLKQFGVAFQLYAGNQGDAVLPNKDGPNVPLGEAWVEGWLGLPRPDCTKLLYLQRGLLVPYLKSTGVWRRLASRDSKVAGMTMPRVRTLSLNCFMEAPTNVPGVTCYRRLSQVVKPSPSDALVFVDERTDTINDASFAMQWDFDESQPGSVAQSAAEVRAVLLVSRRRSRLSITWPGMMLGRFGGWG